MRIESEDFADEVVGSSSGDRLEVSVWRGGRLLHQGVGLESWSFTWDAGDEIRGKGKLVVSDPTGELEPWSLADDLGPGGSRCSITFVSGMSGERVPLGLWRIRKAVPSSALLWYRSVDAWASGGGTIDLTIEEDVFATAKLDRLDAAVVTKSTSLGEVTELLQGIASVVVHDDVEDRPIPAGLVYDDSRIEAIDDHLARLRAAGRAGPEGALEVVPEAGVGPVWTVQAGDGEALIRVGRELSDAAIYNGFTSRAETPAGAQIVGRAQIEHGELAWGGPFGRVVMFHQSPATSQAGVNADARSIRESRIRGGEVELAVDCVAHPGIQLFDIVTVALLSRIGQQLVDGRVVRMAWKSAEGMPSKQMQLTVAVPSERIEIIRRRIRGSSR